MTSLFTQYWDVIPGKFDEYLLIYNQRVHTNVGKTGP